MSGGLPKTIGPNWKCLPVVSKRYSEAQESHTPSPYPPKSLPEASEMQFQFFSSGQKPSGRTSERFFQLHPEVHSKPAHHDFNNSGFGIHLESRSTFYSDTKDKLKCTFSILSMS